MSSGPFAPLVQRSLQGGELGERAVGINPCALRRRCGNDFRRTAAATAIITPVAASRAAAATARAALRTVALAVSAVSMRFGAMGLRTILALTITVAIAIPVAAFPFARLVAPMLLRWLRR